VQGGRSTVAAKIDHTDRMHARHNVEKQRKKEDKRRRGKKVGDDLYKLAKTGEEIKKDV